MQTPKDVAEQIGREYVESVHLPGEGKTRTHAVYRDLAFVIGDLFDMIQVPVKFQTDDPYDDYQDMAETVGEEQCLRVYSEHTDHEYFNHEEQLMFRAVHDWFGHLEADVDFSPEGEFKKWQHMNKYFRSDMAKKVMFAEVVGQVGAVHYLSGGFADERYVQRAFVAPDEWIDQMRDVVE